jgi:hypothetical protein
MNDILSIIFNKSELSEQIKINMLSKWHHNRFPIHDPYMWRKKHIYNLKKNNKIKEILDNPEKYWHSKIDYKNLSASRFFTIDMVNNYNLYKWDWIALSKNIYLPIKTIIKHNYPWDWNVLSRREDLTFDIVAKNPTLPWVYTYMENFDLPLLWTENEVNNYPNYWTLLNFNKLTFEFIKHWRLDKNYDVTGLDCITWQIITDNPTFNWNIYDMNSKADVPFKYVFLYYYLSYVEDNDNIDFYKDIWLSKKEYVLDDLKNCHKFIVKYISGYLCIPLDFILENYNLKWNWEYIAKREDFTEKHAEKLYDIDGIDYNYYKILSKNKNISFAYVLKNLDRGWDWDDVYQTKTIDWNLLTEPVKIEKYAPLAILEKFHTRLNYSEVSYNPNLTLYFITKHINERWDWKALTKHPAVTWEFIEKNKNLRWDLKEIIFNLNVSDQVIVDNYTLLL